MKGMMQLSDNFELSEFGDVPPGLIPIFKQLCERILEPIRAFVGKPILITSGYRSLLQNKAAHGVPDSEHVATSEYCAADFYFDTTFGSLVSLRACFDWLREGQLPWHQCILEHCANGSSIIHISYNTATLPSRTALEGSVHNASPYIAWEVSEYSPQENA